MESMLNLPCSMHTASARVAGLEVAQGTAGGCRCSLDHRAPLIGWDCIVGLEKHAVGVGLPEAGDCHEVRGFKCRMVGGEDVIWPEQHAGTALALHERVLHFAHALCVSSESARLDVIAQANPRGGGARLAAEHHLPVQMQRRLNRRCPDGLPATDDQDVGLDRLCGQQRRKVGVCSRRFMSAAGNLVICLNPWGIPGQRRRRQGESKHAGCQATIFAASFTASIKLLPLALPCQAMSQAVP